MINIKENSESFGKARLLTDVVAGFLLIAVGIFSTLAISGNIAMGTTKQVEATLAGTMNAVRVLRAIPEVNIYLRF
jgi:hypothetical protein